MIYMVLSEKYHWTPEQINDMTLPQVELYMRSDKVVEDLSKGKDPNRVYFTGTPEEQIKKMKRYRELKKHQKENARPKAWRLA